MAVTIWLESEEGLHSVSGWRTRGGRLAVAFVVLSALTMWSSVAARAAMTWTVNKKGDTTSGACPAVCTLRHAAAVAAAGDTIVVPKGTYTLYHNYIDLTRNVTIKGAGADQVTINGNGGRIFDIGRVTTVSISGVTIENGFFDGAGGAILNDGTLTLQDSVVKDSKANGDGAGIASNGTLTVIGSTVEGNQTSGSSNGGGIAAAGALTVLASTISGNTGMNGAGIFNNGSMTITASTISGNTATGHGAGLDEESGSADSVTNSTITANVVSGIYAGPGGGIYDNNSGSGLVGIDDTIVANDASSNGANVYFNDLANGGFEDTIVADPVGGGTTAIAASASRRRSVTTSPTTTGRAASSPPRPTSRASIRSSGS